LELLGMGTLMSDIRWGSRGGGRILVGAWEMYGKKENQKTNLPKG